MADGPSNTNLIVRIMKYIKALDSLRAIAVVLVIISHYLPRTVNHIVPSGATGVVIFFVLSGFLITKILLEGRNKTESTGSSKKIFLKNFYIRRSLRIFPIYYLIVITTFLFYFFTHQQVEKFFYFLSYTANIYYFKTGEFNDYFSHLWTLAIEEQFYLIWPFIILFINKKYLLTCIGSFIAVGIIAQCVAGLTFGMFLTPACFDSLGMGSLLAWVTVYKPRYLRRCCQIAGIGAAAMIILLFLEAFKFEKLIVPFRIQASVIALFIISYITYISYYRKKLFSFSNALLNNSLFASIGKISYGMYLYHTFISYAIDEATPSYIYDALPHFIGNHLASFLFVLKCILVFIVSTLSWKFIEKPLLRHKNHFEFKESEATKVYNKQLELIHQSASC